MAITPINPFTPNRQANAAAAVQPFTTPAAAAPNAAATNPTTLATFSAVLGQLLANLGPLALDTTLTTGGTGNANGGSALGGLTNSVFDLLLLNSLGLGQTATQPAVQQLLVTQLLLNATDTGGNTLGLGLIQAEQVAATLAQQGADNSLFVQLNNVSTQPNPILFSASALAQAFQIGNDTGTPV